jgi:hypothetical protein
MGAALAGRAWPAMDEAAMLDAVLDEGLNWAEAGAAVRTHEWLMVLERHRVARPDLVAAIRSGFGISRGVSGSVRMVDAARLLPLLRSASGTWAWHTSQKEPAPWIRKAVGRFSEWDALIDGQIELLTRQLSLLRSYLPRGTRLSETLDAVREALGAAHETGHGPDDLTQFEALITNARAADWRTIDRLETDLDKATTPDQPEERRRTARVTAAVRDRGVDLTVILDFLASSDNWLTGALKDAAMREGGAAAAAALQVQGLLRHWAETGREEKD